MRKTNCLDILEENQKFFVLIRPRTYQPFLGFFAAGRLTPQVHGGEAMAHFYLSSLTCQSR